MKQEKITKWLQLAAAATTPGETERVLAEARAALSESEYTALLGKLLGEPIADYRRACFNCEGTMTRTIEPEPGWYCGECDTFLPDDQTKERAGL